MRPRFALNDASNGGGSYSESFSYSTFRKCASGKQISNLDCLLLIYLRHWVNRAFGVPWQLSAFGVGISHIVRCGSEPEVGGIAAPRIIALVKYVHQWIKLSVCQKISEAMGLPVFAFVRHQPIPAIAKAAMPIPAFIWTEFLHLSPKAICNHFRILNGFNPPCDSRLPSGLFGNKLLNSHRSLPACATTQRAFLFCQIA